MRNFIYGVVYRNRRGGVMKYWNEVASYESREKAYRYRQKLISGSTNVYTDDTLTVLKRDLRFGEGTYA